MGRDSSRVVGSTFLINSNGTQFGSKGSFVPAEDMSSPKLGQVTGGSSAERHVDFKRIDNSEAEDALRAAAETMYQLGMQQISQGVEVPQDLLIYPEGGVDPVTITQTDVEGLEPGRFLSNNIADFYIRYLERGLSPEHGNRFFFFNSFFFTKLSQSTASTGIDPCKVDYERLWKWTKEANLFAKDYVFIPIIKSHHWSLIIICHLSNLTHVPGEMTRSPCVVHLDPLEGQHESFEGLIRSYVIQAWMERFQVSTHGDQLLALCQMKYVKAEVRKQDNSYDCGAHVLNYIESFLVKSTSPDFSFPSSEMDSHFTGPHFVREVLGKREQIRHLIHELSGISQKRARKRRAIQEVLQSTENLRFLLFHEGDVSSAVRGNSKACMEVVQSVGRTCFNGHGFEISQASTDEDAVNPKDIQSIFISRGDNGPLDGPQIGHMECEDTSESFSLKQQYDEPEVQAGGPTHFNGSVSVAKHACTHADAFEAPHPQSSWISRLDGLELQHAKYERVNEDNMVQHPVSEVVACMDLSGVPEGKNKRGRNMTPEETWVLLSCLVEGGRFCNPSRKGTHWNLVCEEIGKQLGSLVSADQCRLRYDTLLKAYNTYKKYCKKTSKTFSAITNAERLDLKLATTLSEEMYRTMDGIHEIRTKANISQKRMKLSSHGCNNLHPLGSPALNPPAISRGRSFEHDAAVLDSACGTIEAALRNIIPASMFSSLNEDLQSTLLNLVQECSFRGLFLDVRKRNYFRLESVCRRLAILQDCEPRDILKHVFELWKLDFVNVVNMVFEEGGDLAHTEFWEAKRWFLKLEFYEKILKEVLCKNPHLKAYCDTYPIRQPPSQYIRLLSLVGCRKLEHLDLGDFPSLRYLSISFCPKLSLVTGWEVPTGIGSLQISCCDAYLDFPEARYLSSLREMEVSGRNDSRSAIPWQLSQFSQCSKLQRLRVWRDESLSETADLENLKELKFLEFLSLGYCSFSSIQGLSGLQALPKLELVGCSGLRKVPDLGFLKGLTHLDIHNSSVEDVAGVGELHRLTSLRITGCASLEWLPFLGHLTALVDLDLRGTAVKEIPGREDLIYLETWYCDFE